MGSSFGTLATTLGALTGQALAGGAALVDVLSLAVVTPVVAFYLLKDWEAIGAWVDDHLPRPVAPVMRKYAREILRTLAAWLRGQMLLCVILAAYYGVALTAAGLHFGLLLGLITGLVAFIPFVGFGLGLGAAAISGFFSFEGWSGWLAVAGVFVVGQVLESYVLTPRLVGRSVGLHEVWVIFAVMAGGHLFGIVGVLLAIPVAAVIGVLVRAGLAVYRASTYFTGVDRGAEL